MSEKVYTLTGAEQRSWQKPCADLSTVQAALGADKSAATVRALTATGINRIPIPPLASAMSFRFLTGADTNADVVEIYAIRGDNDDYELVVGVTLTGGKQTNGSKFYEDTAVVVASSESWPTAVKFDSTALDSVARVTLNTHGYSEFLLIATTLADAIQVQVVAIEK
jgi:hypothetical protein